MRLVSAVIILSLVASSASAQTAPADRRWHVEGFAGISIFELPTGGSAALPPPGEPITTSGPINQSRRVPTWFLGDGAQLLNGVNAEFGVTSLLTPLDNVLTSLGLAGSNGPAAGIRVRRVLSRSLALELSADLLPGSRELSPLLIDAAEAARASFGPAFSGLLATGPFTDLSVSAATVIANRSSRELATTLAAQWTLGSRAFAPYVTLGGGLVSQIGSLPSITLTGSYRFNIQGMGGGAVPINESDTLRLHYQQGSALVGVVGAGVRRPFGERLGISIDGRLLLGQQTLSLRLDSNPVVATGTPAGFIESFSTPAIQFSNNPGTGRESTLSGPPLNAFKAFSTSGLQTRYIVSAGVFVRF
jgi:hypothetical protein